jgi:hypothetical protein
MKKKVTPVVCTLILIMSNGIYGYFYHVSVMKKKLSKKDQHAQNIILLGDCHDKKHPANQHQKIYLNYILQRCMQKKSKLIVEDLGSINNDGKMFCCNFKINCPEGLLSALAYKARMLGIMVDNIEFRYCRVAALGPLLHHTRQALTAIKSSGVITTHLLYKEVVEELKKIEHYDDNKQCNALYKKAVLSVRELLKKIKLPNNSLPVAQHCLQFPISSYKEEVEKLCIFDSALIDMNILHSIVISPEVASILVIAGGSHTHQIATVLQRMGYETVLQRINDDCQPIDISLIDPYIQ